MAMQLHEAPVASAELKISLVEPLECKLCIWRLLSLVGFLAAR